MRRSDLFVVITGLFSYPASLVLTYPNTDPVMILRDPPGGNSFASIESGQALTSSTSFSGGGSFGSGMIFAGGPSVDPKTYSCAGGLFYMFCAEQSSGGVEVNVKAGVMYTPGFQNEKNNIFSYTFSNKVTTSQDAGDSSGSGDLFLTISATMSFQKAIQISVNNCTATSNLERKLEIEKKKISINILTVSERAISIKK